MILLKWLMFFFVGLPIQLLIYLIYPVLYFVWVMFFYKPVFSKQPAEHQFNLPPGTGTATIYNGALLDNADDHGAFSMYGFVQRDGLELLEFDGSMIRKRNADGTLNRWQVSGDVTVSWFFANELATQKASDETVRKVADSYIKNLGTLSYDDTAQGYVSGRCSNFGVNIALDSDFANLSQPALGPQYYTTAAVLAGAYNQGLKYKVMFWAHWLLMGGWYWTWAPMIYVNETDWYYVRDITMKALYVQLQVFGPRWWITKPMKFINDKITSHENDLFNAMMKRQPGPLPDAMNSFFSQSPDASSTLNDRMSAYIPAAIHKIYAETKWED